MDNRQQDIRAVAISRGVQYLFHYTPACNLVDILRFGILPRTELRHSPALATVIDEFRLDGKPDAVSVSLSRVNNSLLTRKRSKIPGPWIILALSADILWTQDVEFCWADAASNDIKKHSGRRDGQWAFRQMFAGSAAERAALLPFQPTAPEAEVHVLGRIDQRKIVGAIVNDVGFRAEVEAVFREMLPKSAYIEYAAF